MGFLSKLFGGAKEPQTAKRGVNPAARAARMMTSNGMLQQAAGTGRLEQNWATWPTTADALIYHNWRTLVARSREQSENNDHARKFLQLCVDNVIGPNGVELQAGIKDPSGTPDTLASKAIEEAFDLFSKKGTFEITGTMSRAMVERLVIRTVAKDGEVFAIKVRGDKSLGGYCLQLADPMLVHPQHFEPLQNGNHIRHGIEFTPEGRPVAYYFQEYDERQIGYVQMTWKSAKRIPAEDVIHLFIPEMVGQKRGLPWMRTALWKMRMLAGFEDSAVVNARIGAAKMGFFRDPNNEDDQEPITMDAEPGVFEDIGNREFIPFNPQFPSGDFDPFCKAMLRSIAAGLGVSYNNLANDLTSVNFSSIRQGALDEREVWKGLQQWFIDGWSWPVYEGWLQIGLLSGKLQVAGKPLKFERLDKYKAVSWQGRRWGWIDPQAEMSANQIALALNLTSASAIIRDSGRDPEDVYLEIQRDKEEFKRLKIEPAPLPGSPQANAAAAGKAKPKKAEENAQDPAASGD